MWSDGGPSGSTGHCQCRLYGRRTPHRRATPCRRPAAGNPPAAVLTGPAIAAHSQGWPIRRPRLADTCGMVRVSLQHHPLTATATPVWNGDLPRLLQQMLFNTAESLTERPVRSPPI